MWLLWLSRRCTRFGCTSADCTSRCCSHASPHNACKIQRSSRTNSTAEKSYSRGETTDFSAGGESKYWKIFAQRRVTAKSAKCVTGTCSLSAVTSEPHQMTTQPLILSTLRTTSTVAATVRCTTASAQTFKSILIVFHPRALIAPTVASAPDFN